MRIIKFLALSLLTIAGARAQALKVDSSGKVGIGTSTPQAKLEVNSSGFALMLNQPSAADIYMRFHVPGVRWWTVGSKGNGDFWISNSPEMGTDAPTPLVITNAGNVGIGTLTPAQKLVVAGNSVTTGSATVGSLVVGTSTIFTTGAFESAELSYPGNGQNLTAAHGLGGIPKFVTVSIRCKTAEFGWSVGDEIMISTTHMISNNHGLTIGLNPTNIKLTQFGYIYIHGLMYGANNIQITNAANWRIILRAWR